MPKRNNEGRVAKADHAKQKAKRQRAEYAERVETVMAPGFGSMLWTAMIYCQQLVQEIMIKPNNRDWTLPNYPKIADNGLWRCTRCKVKKISKEFGKNPKNKNETKHLCKACDHIYQQAYDSTVRGRLKKLLRTALNSTVGKSKVKGKGCDLTLAQLAWLWVRQGGRCYYSRHFMTTRTHTDWLVSLERLDDKLGYTISNVVLVAQRFNTCGHNGRNKYDVIGSAKWSREKYLQVPTLINTPIDLDALAQAIATARIGGRGGNQNGKKRFSKKDLWDGELCDLWECRHCGDWKPLEGHFQRATKNKNRPTGHCRPCQNWIYSDHHNSVLRLFVGDLIKDSRKNNKDRLVDGKPLDHKLTIEHVLEMIEHQRGRCDYSGIPMQFRKNCDWKCSIERRDDTRGYVPDNVVLICAEFNTCVRNKNSGVRPDEVEGTSQWSRALLREAWRTLV